MPEDRPTDPIDVSEEKPWFDRIADATSNIVARPSFFLASLGLLLVWAAAGPSVEFSHHWVDVLHVVIAVITFLMVALLQNEEWRANKATQRKLNAIAAALAEVMGSSDVDKEHVRQLNAAVGLEKRESSSR